MFDDFDRMSAMELRRRIARKEISPVEVLMAAAETVHEVALVELSDRFAIIANSTEELA